MRIPFKRVYDKPVNPPFLFGYAYYDINKDESVYFPIPFNLVIRLLRMIYFKLRKGMFPVCYERDFLKFYDKAYNEGYRSGREMYPCPQCGKERKRELYLICCDCLRKNKEK